MPGSEVRKATMRPPALMTGVRATPAPGTPPGRRLRRVVRPRAMSMPKTSDRPLTSAGSNSRMLLNTTWRPSRLKAASMCGRGAGRRRRNAAGGLRAVALHRERGASRSGPARRTGRRRRRRGRAGRCPRGRWRRRRRGSWRARGTARSGRRRSERRVRSRMRTMPARPRAWPPAEVTLTRVVRGSRRSRTKTSGRALVSPATRFGRRRREATNRRRRLMLASPQVRRPTGRRVDSDTVGRVVVADRRRRRARRRWRRCAADRRSRRARAALPPLSVTSSASTAARQEGHVRARSACRRWRASSARRASSRSSSVSVPLAEATQMPAPSSDEADRLIGDGHGQRDSAASAEHGDGVVGRLAT